MAHNTSTGRITAPVNIFDIQKILGRNESDIGSLIRSGSVNMWSKYKPVRLSAKGFMDEWNENLNTWDTARVKWFKGDVYNVHQGYGWMAPQEHTLLTVLQNYNPSRTVALHGWQECLPRGLANNEPYRFTDFAGYNHKANKPASIYNCDDEIIVPQSSSGNTQGVTIRPSYIKPATDDNPVAIRSYITPKDVLQLMWGDLATVYEGFAIVKEDFSAVVTFTTNASMTITQGNVSSGTPSPLQLKDGAYYYICPFYTNAQFTDPFQPQQVGNDVMFSTYPSLKPVKTHVTTKTEDLTGVAVSLRAQYNVEDCSVTGRFSFTDTNGGSRDISNVMVRYYYGNNTQAEASTPPETIHVANHQTVEREFTFTGVTDAQTVKVKLFGNGTLLRSVIAAQPMSNGNIILQ